MTTEELNKIASDLRYTAADSLGGESLQEMDMLVFAKTQTAAYDDFFGTSDDEPRGMIEKVEG